MSSSAYSAEIGSDETLRRIVLLSGVGAAVIGFALILVLPWHPSLRLIVSSGWLGLLFLELYKIRCAYRRYCALRVDSHGNAWLKDRAGEWHGARLLAGSVLLRRFGWIRLASVDGGACAELVRGHCRDSAAWRRLQVVWRHIGAAGLSC